MSNEDVENRLSPQRSWLERLSHALLREPKDREQLIELLRDAEQRHLLDAHALEMMEGVLLVSDMQVRDIMIPRADMISIEHDARLDEFLPFIIESAHSRFPVFDKDHEEVIGILLAKDLLKYTLNDHQQFVISSVLRPAVFVPESTRLDMLLQEFRNKRTHMAMVIDEYGGVAGLVTIEDVLEQIVGEIEDESDVEDDETLIKKHSSTRYILKATTPLVDFNKYFAVNMASLNKDETIGDIILREFGHVPRRGEAIRIGHFLFKVLHADNRQIRLLRLVTRGKAAIKYTSAGSLSRQA